MAIAASSTPESAEDLVNIFPPYGKSSGDVTAAGAASGGTKTYNAITSGTGLAVGTATWGRFTKSDHTTAVHDCSVCTSGADINLNDAAITIGGTVSLTAYTFSMPVAQ